MRKKKRGRWEKVEEKERGKGDDKDDKDDEGEGEHVCLVFEVVWGDGG